MPGRGFGGRGRAQVGFDEAVDEQGDADDGDERVDAVVVVQEDRAHVQGLFEVAVALFDDPLVFVDVEYVERGECLSGRVGQVGGQGVEPVEGDALVMASRVAVPGDGGFAVVDGRW